MRTQHVVTLMLVAASTSFASMQADNSTTLTPSTPAPVVTTPAPVPTTTPPPVVPTTTPAPPTPTTTPKPNTPSPPTTDAPKTTTVPVVTTAPVSTTAAPLTTTPTSSKTPDVTNTTVAPEGVTTSAPKPTTVNSPDETQAPPSPSSGGEDLSSPTRAPLASTTTPSPTKSATTSAAAESSNTTTLIVAIIGGVAGVLLLAIAFVLLRRRRSAYDDDDDVLSPPNKSTRPTHQEQHFLALGAPALPPQQQPLSSTSPPVFSPAGSHLSQPNPYFQPSRVSPPKYATDGFVSNAQRLSSPPFHAAAAAAHGNHFDADSICESAASGNSHNNLWVSAMESGRTDSAVKQEPMNLHDSTHSLWDDDDSNARGSSSSYNRGDSFLSGSNVGSFNNNSEHMGDESPFEYGTPTPTSRNNSITL